MVSEDLSVNKSEFFWFTIYWRCVMKILKRYILELCFILSFALPFIRGANG